MEIITEEIMAERLKIYLTNNKINFHTKALKEAKDELYNYVIDNKNLSFKDKYHYLLNNEILKDSSEELEFTHPLIDEYEEKYRKFNIDVSDIFLFMTDKGIVEIRDGDNFNLINLIGDLETLDYGSQKHYFYYFNHEAIRENQNSEYEVMLFHDYKNDYKRYISLNEMLDILYNIAVENKIKSFPI